MFRFHEGADKPIQGDVRKNPCVPTVRPYRWKPVSTICRTTVRNRRTSGWNRSRCSWAIDCRGKEFSSGALDTLTWCCTVDPLTWFRAQLGGITSGVWPRADAVGQTPALSLETRFYHLSNDGAKPPNLGIEQISVLVGFRLPR